MNKRRHSWDLEEEQITKVNRGVSPKTSTETIELETTNNIYTDLTSILGIMFLDLHKMHILHDFKHNNINNSNSYNEDKTVAQHNIFYKNINDTINGITKFMHGETISDNITDEFLKNKLNSVNSDFYIAFYDNYYHQFAEVIAYVINVLRIQNTGYKCYVIIPWYSGHYTEEYGIYDILSKYNIYITQHIYREFMEDGYKNKHNQELPMYKFGLPVETSEYGESNAQNRLSGFSISPHITNVSYSYIFYVIVCIVIIIIFIDCCHSRIKFRDIIMNNPFGINS
jgi:hypothetical protein